MTEDLAYAQHPNSGRVHRADCSAVTIQPNSFRPWDPNKVTDRLSALTWHKVCLPDGMPEARRPDGE